MITDKRAAELCAGLYGTPTAVPVAFSQIDPGTDDGICWAISREDDVDVIVMRGSMTPEDWLRDSMAAPYMSRRMGPVHHGFYLGLDNAWRDMKLVLRPGSLVAVVGHSLGAARAALLTGIMLDDGYPPAARIVFGEPKPGFAQLADFIKPVPARSYRNGAGENHDIVTDLPFTIPALRLNYVHPAPLTYLECKPDPSDQSGMFVYHHMDLYLAGVSAIAL